MPTIMRCNSVKRRDFHISYIRSYRAKRALRTIGGLFSLYAMSSVFAGRIARPVRSQIVLPFFTAGAMERFATWYGISVA